jgi:hypothetical protein
MSSTQLLIGAGIVAAIAAAAPDVQAQTRGRSSVVVGRAVPRARAPRVGRPHIVTVVPYRPYRHPARFSLGFAYGYGRPYFPYYASPYPYGYGYGHGYRYYPRAYTHVPAYGGVRVDLPQRDAQVFVDGYYAGIVDDFDGAFQHLDLPAGPHRIEVRAPGFQTIAFDVNVEPGRTIHYRADLVPALP